MARRKKKKAEEVDPAERARIKKLRARMRREERKKSGGSKPRDVPSDYSQPFIKDNYDWLRRSDAKAYATKIINNYPERPYWASIEYDGELRVSRFFPCTMFRRNNRVYYGFLFRAHREEFVSEHYRTDVRREYTGADGRTPL